MGKTEVKENAREIEKYLEVLVPLLEPGGGIPESPMNRKERGTSRPPVSDYVLRLWKSNPHAGRINDMLREAAHSTEDVQIEGRAMWKILRDVLFDHTAIRRWKDENGKDLTRFSLFCHLLAQRLAKKHDTPQGLYKITVYIEPWDEPERAKTRQAQKANTLYTRCRMVEQLEEVREEFPGCTEKEAMEILSERKTQEGKDWSVRKLVEAKTVVNKLREATCRSR